jgi:hypothetical protein
MLIEEKFKIVLKNRKWRIIVYIQISFWPLVIVEWNEGQSLWYEHIPNEIQKIIHARVNNAP